jgi:hypothetical protein
VGKYSYRKADKNAKGAKQKGCFCIFAFMKEFDTLTDDLLKSATKSVERKARRKKVPIAISEDGIVKIIYPDKSIKILSRSVRKKK